MARPADTSSIGAVLYWLVCKCEAAEKALALNGMHDRVLVP